MDYVDYPRIPFAEHVKGLYANWKQGEHLIVSGPTSAGKTTLIKPLLNRRSHIVALFTKPKDASIKKSFGDYKRFERWPKHGFSRNETRVMIWPKPEKRMSDTIAKHREIMEEALDRAFTDGNRAVLLDEGLYLSDPQFGNLAKSIGMMHYTGRSHGITMITLMQRPFNIPRIVLSSASHAYIARTYDAGDQKRLSELANVDSKEIVANMSNLTDRHDFIYLNPQGDSQSAIVNSAK